MISETQTPPSADLPAQAHPSGIETLARWGEAPDDGTQIIPTGSA